jgi:hypothetical protein
VMSLTKLPHHHYHLHWNWWCVIVIIIVVMIIDYHNNCLIVDVNYDFFCFAGSWN